MSRKKTSKSILYKSVPLNYLALGIALSGFFLPIFMESPAQLVNDAQSMLADSGATLSAAVPPNQYNTLAEQLDAKEQALNDREVALKASRTGIFSSSDIFGLISLVLSLILLGLLGLNFYLDSRRGTRTGISGKYSVDLR
jgi:predicted PurR-regulated permease PerM